MKKYKLIGNEKDIIFYTDEEGNLQKEVVLQNEDVWLNVNAIAELFDVQRPAITKHINIFHIMPKSTFEKMGCSKSESITLVNSMSNLNIVKNLEKIKCKSLILCGAKDNVNMESARLLNNSIKNLVDNYLLL